MAGGGGEACVRGGGHVWQGVYGRGDYAYRGACMVGMACMAGGCVAGGACMAGGVYGRAACMAGWHAWQGVCMAGKTAIAAGGMHPTEMHSCVITIALNICTLSKPATDTTE